MSEFPANGTVRANEVAAENDGFESPQPASSESGRNLPDHWFAALCRHLWHFKAAAQLVFYTGRSDRTCRAWAQGINDSDATTLAVLLRSDHGYRVLKFIMRGSDATWWINLQSAIELFAKLGAE